MDHDDQPSTSQPSKQSYKLPAFQFYPGDWSKDPGIRALTYEEKGIWFAILLLMHESEERGVLLLNGLPMTEDALAMSLGLDKQKTTTTLTTLLRYGVAKVRDKDKAIYNKRMVDDEKIRVIRAKCGKMGGNPNLLNQIPTTQVNQIPTPSSSSSSSSSSSVDTYVLSKKPVVAINKGGMQGGGLPQPDPFKVTQKINSLTTQDIQAIERWADYRLKKGLPFDEMAADALQMRYSATPGHVADDVNWSIENGWKTINSRPKERINSPPKSAAERNQDSTIKAMKQIFEETGYPNGFTRDDDDFGTS